MGGDPCSQHVHLDLLEQFEFILDHDNLIDEVGFIHPLQFAALNNDSGVSCPPVNVVELADELLEEDMKELHEVQYDTTVFWNSNHKLAISTEVLPQLYHAAMRAYMDVSRSYRGSKRLISVKLDSLQTVIDEADFDISLESKIMKHSRALLILSSDFNSAWNSRKLVLSTKHELSLFIDELCLSTVILSYAPKSEYAWTHRRWVIGMVAEKFQNLPEIVRKESELVKTIAENSKMNYRAWNHRCWLVLYMTRSQGLDELNESRKWAELHVADNCCFHYRRRLMFRMLEDNLMKEETGLDCNADVCMLWKEELKWNKLLIDRYVAREALWTHRRFLSLCWIKYFITSPRFELHHLISCVLDDFLHEELHLLRACLKTSADDFDDDAQAQAQAQYAAAYILWISKVQIAQTSLPEGSNFEESLKDVGDLKAILMKTCPEKSLLWEGLFD